jgi:flagellar biosynthesis/type III secretory pathway protein FliH
MVSPSSPSAAAAADHAFQPMALGRALAPTLASATPFVLQPKPLENLVAQHPGLAEASKQAQSIVATAEAEAAALLSEAQTLIAKARERAAAIEAEAHQQVQQALAEGHEQGRQEGHAAAYAEALDPAQQEAAELLEVANTLVSQAHATQQQLLGQLEATAKQAMHAILLQVCGTLWQQALQGPTAKEEEKAGSPAEMLVPLWQQAVASLGLQGTITLVVHPTVLAKLKGQAATAQALANLEAFEWLEDEALEPMAVVALAPQHKAFELSWPSQLQQRLRP